MQIGQLTIEMAANVARLTADMQAARSVVERNARAMKDAAGLVGKALGAIGAGLTLAAFTGFIRGAIDAADATSKLSQKTGIAVEDLGGLTLAYRLAGIEGTGMETSIVKLSKAVSDNNIGLRAIGVATRTASGDLRETKDVLRDVAEKFKVMEDGTAKTAVAVEVFGKTGAELIPLLNGGAEALDAMDAQARKLGLTISTETGKKAEEFNDTLELIKLGGQGIATTVAAQLLPTMTNLAAGFLEVTSEGDFLEKTANAVGTALKTLFSIGVGVSQVFSTMGTIIGGAAAGAMAMLKGNFEEANTIGNMIASDISDSWSKSAQTITNAWEATANTTVVTAARTLRVQKDLIGAEKEREAATKKGSAATDKAAEAAEKYATEGAKLAASLLAIDSGLSGDFADKWDKLTAGYKANKTSLADLTKAQAKLLADQPAIKASTAAQTKAIEEQQAAWETVRVAMLAYTTSQESATEALRSANEQMKLENELIGATAQQRAAILVQRNQTIILTKQATLAELERQSAITGTMTREEIALAAEIELLKERNGLILDQGAREGAATVMEEGKKMAESINNSLTDALLRGFESGKAFAKNMRDVIVNMFKTMVLRPIISAIINPIAGGLGGLFGGGGAGGAGGGFGGMGNLLSIGSSLFSGLGSAFMSGMSEAAAGAAFVGPPISAAGGAMGTAGSLGGIAAALGPWLIGAAAIAMLWKPLFGKTLKDAGVQGTFGGESGFEGENYKYYKGGLFRSNSTETSALDEPMRAALGDAFKAMKDQVIDFADALGLSTERLDGYTSKMKISTFGMDDAKAQAAIAEALKTANNDLAEQVIGSWTETTEKIKKQVRNTTGLWWQDGGPQFNTVEEDVTRRSYKPSEFAKEGEKAIDTLTRLATSLITVNAIWDTLGNTLLDSSLAGGDLASKIVEAFGGLEQLAAATSAFFQGFYSEDEKRATAKRQLDAEAAKLGLTLPKTAAEYRELAKAQDRTTEAGRAAYAFLIKMGPAYLAIEDSARAAAQAMLEAAGISGSKIADLFRDALLGRVDAAQAGEAVATMVTEGIYNSLANGFANQITELMTSQLITPVIQAAVTGSAISAAVSQASIKAMVDSAKAAAEALAIIFKDPAFLDAIAQIDAAIREAFGAAGKPLPAPAAPPPPTYEGVIDGYGGPAESVKNAWADMLQSIVQQTEDTRRELDRLGLSSYDAALAAIDDKAQQTVRDLEANGYNRDKRTALQDAQAASAAANSRVANYSDPTKFDQNGYIAPYLQRAIADADLYAQAVARLTAELGALPPEVVALVEAEKALLQARNAATAKATTDALSKEVAQLSMTAVGREFEDLSDRANAYIDALTDLGQATEENLAIVGTWTDAMREKIRGNAYDQLLSPDELKARNTQQLADDFGALGATVPETSKSLRDMIDAARAAGNTGLADKLLELVGAFVALRNSAQAPVISLSSATDAAFSALQRAVEAQKRAIGTQLTAARDLASEVGNVFDALKGAVADLYRSVDGTAQQSAATAKAFIANALSGALATGSLPDARALQEAIAAARGGMDGKQYATQFEADRDRLVLAGQLDQLKNVAGRQLTEAERQMELLQKQLESLDHVLEEAEAQINVLRGIDTSVLSVEAAVRALAAAIAAEAAGRNQPAPGEGATSAFADTYARLRASGLTPEQVKQTIEGIYGPQLNENWDALEGGGVRQRGAGGPSVQTPVVPAVPQYSPAAAGGSNNARLEALVADLTAQVIRLQEIGEDGNGNTRQFANQFDEVSAGGNGLAVQVMS